MKGLITRVGNHEIVNDGDFKYVIKKDESKKNENNRTKV